MWKMNNLYPTENIFIMHCAVMCETQHSAGWASHFSVEIRWLNVQLAYLG